VDEVVMDGGSTVLSYAIEMDDGSGFTPVYGDPDDSMDLTVIVTAGQGVVSGETY
jgi:hypothetical protein